MATQENGSYLGIRHTPDAALPLLKILMDPKNTDNLDFNAAKYKEKLAEIANQKK